MTKTPARRRHDAKMAGVRERGTGPAASASPSGPRTLSGARSPPDAAPTTGGTEPWSLATLRDLLIKRGWKPHQADGHLDTYYREGWLARSAEGPFVQHERRVREALEAGVDVSREILELHPRLLPEADPLHGLEPGSREAELVREAVTSGLVQFNDQRTSYSNAGRWASGDRRAHKDWDGNVERTAWDSLKRYWQDPERPDFIPGPVTFAEERRLIDQEAERLAKRYKDLGLPAPRYPVPHEFDYQDRLKDYEVNEAKQRGVPPQEFEARELLREAHRYLSRSIGMTESEPFQARLDPGDPDHHNEGGANVARGYSASAYYLMTQLQDAMASDPASLDAVARVLRDEAWTSQIDPALIEQARDMHRRVSERGVAS